VKKRQQSQTSNRALKFCLTLVGVVFAAVAVASGLEIILGLNEYQEARNEYADLREQFAPPDISLGTLELIEETDHEIYYEEIEIDQPSGGMDLEGLREINPGVVAWITVPDSSIDYPIVQGRDNVRYLHHTVAGVRNAAGAIFLDYRNAANFSDPKSIVYGHEMRDGSMFASLHSWNGDQFIIHTQDKTLVFEVFNRQTVHETHDLYQFIDIDDTTKIVTLSTCVSGRQDMRLVVQGKLLNYW